MITENDIPRRAARLADSYNRVVNILLIATYELGRQPFGLASPAAWLRKRGHQVVCLDVSRQSFDEHTVRAANLIALYVPMHTAARLALQLVEPLRRLNRSAGLCAYGLYAPLSAEAFRKLGVVALFGGEFEDGLTQFVEQVSRPNHSGDLGEAKGENIVSLARQKFEIPDRRGLAPLRQYAHLVAPSGEHRAVGYTEASHGCKHLCRHCPVVPVYKGVFRIVDREVVLADIRQQVAAGAQHITFGDPDFFNGIGHALPLVEAVHREFPQLSYDVTIKVEHLRRHEQYLPMLRDTGCILVTSAVEGLDDEVLRKLEKGHTRADFFHVVAKFRDVGLALHPTFVPFTPWTTLESFRDLLSALVELDLVLAVTPIQLAIRLLITAHSRLLELRDIQNIIGAFDQAALVHPWHHADPRVDALCEKLQDIVAASDKHKLDRAQTFERIWNAANEAVCANTHADDEYSEHALRRRRPILAARAAVPYLTEPWYC